MPPRIDLLVSSVDGACTLPIQVKTMRWARLHNPKDGCQWRCSEGSLRDGFYAFVDLRQHKKATHPERLPDFYFVPVADLQKWKRYKGNFYKPNGKVIWRYLNNWDLLRRELALS